MTQAAITAPGGAGTRAARATASSRGRRRLLNQMLVLAAFFLAWELAARSMSVMFFPPISAIAMRAQQLWLSGPASSLFLTPAAIRDIGISLYRTLLGFSLGSIVGIAIGILIGFLPRFGAYVEPLIHFFRGIPKTALLPMFVIFLGIDDAMKIGLIIVALFSYVTINTIDGVRSVVPLQLDCCRVYGISRLRQIFSVVLPSAAPTIFASLRFGLAVALAVMVVAEMYVANSGLGYFTILSQRTFRIMDMWAGVLALGVLGNLLSIALGLIEGRVLKWHRGMQGGNV